MRLVLDADIHVSHKVFGSIVHRMWLTTKSGKFPTVQNSPNTNNAFRGVSRVSGKSFSDPFSGKTSDRETYHMVMWPGLLSLVDKLLPEMQKVTCQLPVFLWQETCGVQICPGVVFFLYMYFFGNQGVTPDRSFLKKYVYIYISSRYPT